MSDSAQPYRQQPTRLPCSWDSPGMNTGLGCHFLLKCMKVKSESEVAHSCPTLSDPMDCSSLGSSLHGILQARILEWVAIPSIRGSSQPRDQTQVPHSCRQILYQLSHKRSPSTLEWVAYPFSSRSFPINWPNFPKIWQIPTQELNQGLLHCRQIIYQLA